MSHGGNVTPSMSLGQCARIDFLGTEFPEMILFCF